MLKGNKTPVFVCFLGLVELRRQRPLLFQGACFVRKIESQKSTVSSYNRERTGRSGFLEVEEKLHCTGFDLICSLFLLFFCLRRTSSLRSHGSVQRRRSCFCSLSVCWVSTHKRRRQRRCWCPRSSARVWRLPTTSGSRRGQLLATHSTSSHFISWSRKSIEAHIYKFISPSPRKCISIRSSFMWCSWYF